jgi:hypothetical protein
MNIIQAMEDRRVFRPLFRDLETWRPWMTYLKALFGLPVEGVKERNLFSASTGLGRPGAEKVRESFVACGRRSGKSYVSAIIAVFLACFKDWAPYLSPGERGSIFIIAVDKMQAGIIKQYVSGILRAVSILKGKIERETGEAIDLKGNVSIAVKTCSFRTVRGYTLLAAILEELAFYRSEESANPDKEILAAVRPALATIPESLLLGISTVYSRSGVLWDQFSRYFGKPGSTLLWKAESRTMNPTLSKTVIEKALDEDPEAARAEWLSEWRSDINAFLSEEAIRACVMPGRLELPKVKDVTYFAFADPSGGRQDSFTLAIAHREKSGKVILDVLRERRPPFRPEAVVEELCELLKTYGISRIEADRYAGEWVVDSFKKFGVQVEAAEKTASELYLEFLPMITQGSVELLDQKRLISQLASLERRTRAGGKDLVTHYAGGHDDCANAAAGAVLRGGRRQGKGAFIGWTQGDVY